MSRLDKPILAMLHLNGSHPEHVHEGAKREIEQLCENDADAVLVEDYFGTPDDVERALDYLSRNYSDPVCGHLRPGSGMRGHDRLHLYEKTCNGDFAEKLAELRVKYPVFLLGGVRFKYQPVRSGRGVEEDLKLGKERCDAVVVTGSGTGIHTDMEKIRQFRDTLGGFPLFVGAGMTAETCGAQLAIADGAIAGSWFKQGGRTEAPRRSGQGKGVYENRKRCKRTGKTARLVERTRHRPGLPNRQTRPVAGTILSQPEFVAFRCPFLIPRRVVTPLPLRCAARPPPQLWPPRGSPARQTPRG